MEIRPLRPRFGASSSPIKGSLLEEASRQQSLPFVGEVASQRDDGEVIEKADLLGEIHRRGREGELHTVLLHDVHDVKVQVVLHLQERSDLIGEQIGRDGKVDAGIPEAEPFSVWGLSSSMAVRSAISCSSLARVVS